MAEKCPLCGNENSRRHVQQTDTGKNFHVYECLNCGHFGISSMSAINRLDDIQLLFIRHKLYKFQQESQETVILHPKTISDLIDNIKFPSPAEAMDNLLEYIAHISGDVFGVAQPINIQQAMAAVGVWHNNNLDDYLFRQGEKLEYIYRVPANPDIHAGLTLKGWQRVEELKVKSKNSKRAFMAMQFNDNELNIVFNDHIKKAIAETGFHIDIVSNKAGNIDNRIRAEIRTAKFLIADLTYGNQGAYFEAGFAEGLEIPVIYTCRKNEFHSKSKKKKVHFDIRQSTFVPWALETIDEDMLQLKATIRETFPLETSPDLDEMDMFHSTKNPSLSRGLTNLMTKSFGNQLGSSDGRTHDDSVCTKI